MIDWQHISILSDKYLIPCLFQIFSHQPGVVSLAASRVAPPAHEYTIISKPIVKYERPWVRRLNRIKQTHSSCPAPERWWASWNNECLHVGEIQAIKQNMRSCWGAAQHFRRNMFGCLQPAVKSWLLPLLFAGDLKLRWGQRLGSGRVRTCCVSSGCCSFLMKTCN